MDTVPHPKWLRLSQEKMSCLIVPLLADEIFHRQIHQTNKKNLKQRLKQKQQKKLNLLSLSPPSCHVGYIIPEAKQRKNAHSRVTKMKVATVFLIVVSFHENKSSISVVSVIYKHTFHNSAGRDSGVIQGRDGLTCCGADGKEFC